MAVWGTAAFLLLLPVVAMRFTNEVTWDGTDFIVFGAMLAAALTVTPTGKLMGTLAVALAAVNVFGGFLVTRRMLEMFKKKTKNEAKK